MTKVELSREDVVTIAQAVEEFRDESSGSHNDANRVLAERIREILPTSVGDSFVLTEMP